MTIAMTTQPKYLEGIAAELWAIHNEMLKGCGNRGCAIREPTQKAADDLPCHCTPNEFAIRLRDIADRLANA